MLQVNEPTVAAALGLRAGQEKRTNYDRGFRLGGASSIRLDLEVGRRSFVEVEIDQWRHHLGGDETLTND